jgi:hypothetical protein
MRTLMLCLLFGPGLLLVQASRAEDQAPADAKDPQAKAEAFVPPDGWRPKKRGKFTVYCRKETPRGTRIPTEICYDEEGIRAMLAAQNEDRERVDQLRRVCSSQAACGSN